MGVANRRSLAWAIAERLDAEGARLAFTFGQPRTERPLRQLVRQLGDAPVIPCDVRSDSAIQAAFARVAETFDGHLNFMVHSIAFAEVSDLAGSFLDTPRQNFATALDVSAYSLVACSRAAAPLMRASDGGAILTISYLGAERVIPHYNVMGVAKAALEASVRYLAYDLGPDNIRVNALSAGPLPTVAARAVPTFHAIAAAAEQRSPLRRSISPADVGGAASFLLSEDARNVTGTTFYVDAGYHAVGM